MQKQENQSSRTQRAVQFSRTNPPRTLIPLNYNHVGAHNELLPNTEYEPQYSKLIKSVKKSIIHKIKTVYDDPNKSKETPLHPPYMSTDSSGLQGQSTMSTGPLAF